MPGMEALLIGLNLLILAAVLYIAVLLRRRWPPLPAGMAGTVTGQSADRQVLLDTILNLEQQNQQLAIETVTSLGKLIGNRDQYTGEHSLRVRDIALTIGTELRLPPGDMNELAIAAVLHDIGKIGIPEQILNKTGKLTESEFAIIQKHPQLGYDALINIKQLERVAEYILYHHECFDGRGYPCRKKGDEIPLISRILSVADVYEAITSDRVYRKAMNLEQTMMVMRAGRETKFDPEVLDAFFCVLRRERPDTRQYLYENEAVS